MLSGKLKTLTSSSYRRVEYVLLKFYTRFLITKVCKSVFGIVLFCLDLELFRKIKNDLVCTFSLKPLLLISQDPNKIKKKSRTRFCRDCLVGKVCKISAKNIKLCGSWISSNISVFQTNNLVSWR